MMTQIVDPPIGVSNSSIPNINAGPTARWRLEAGPVGRQSAGTAVNKLSQLLPAGVVRSVKTLGHGMGLTLE